jgi:uncharacterized cupredoxin-like copper-binding protein
MMDRPLRALVAVAVITIAAGSASGAAVDRPRPVSPAAQAVDTTIIIRSTGSSLEFEPPEIAVKSGKRVRIRLANFGTLPHNIVLVRTEDDIDVLAAEAVTATGSGYVPLALKERMIAFSALALPGGNTVEMVFTVPPPGEYMYVCLYPGHHNTMLGTLRALR